MIELRGECFGKTSAVYDQIAGVEQSIRPHFVCLSVRQQTTNLRRTFADFHEVTELFCKRRKFNTRRTAILFSRPATLTDRLDADPRTLELVCGQHRIFGLYETLDLAAQ